MAAIRKRRSPALVGKAEAAEILGVHPNNMGKVRGVPAPLQDRGIAGFAVRATPLWVRVEIEELAAERATSAAA